MLNLKAKSKFGVIAKSLGISAVICLVLSMVVAVYSYTADPETAAFMFPESIWVGAHIMVIVAPLVVGRGIRWNNTDLVQEPLYHKVSAIFVTLLFAINLIVLFIDHEFLFIGPVLSLVRIPVMDYFDELFRATPDNFALYLVFGVVQTFYLHYSLVVLCCLISVFALPVRARKTERAHIEA